MGKRILLVDDEPLILKGLKYTLEQDGYETDTAVDGQEALDKFFSGVYDLVLLDVMLPKVDGLSVLPAHPQNIQCADYCRPPRARIWTKSSVWNTARTTT